MSDLLVTAGLAYRTLQDEDALNREQRAATAGVAAVNKTAELLLDLRASLHAYVAPGQGLPFWGKRAQETLDQLSAEPRHSRWHASRRVADRWPSRSTRVDQLSAAEQRARTYVSRDEMQLAGDVIFTEVRDLLAVATTQVQSVREWLDAASTIGAPRRSGRNSSRSPRGVVALWIVIALLLLPTEPKPAVQDPARLAERAQGNAEEAHPRCAPDARCHRRHPRCPSAPDVLATLKTVAEICADLSALTDPGALEGALARVSALLNATGSSSGWRRTTAPRSRRSRRTASIRRSSRASARSRRDSSNLTAAAFRENAAQDQRRHRHHTGALSPSRCAAPPAPPACSRSS